MPGSKKIVYKKITIPSGSTMKIWKFIIDNPKGTLAECEKALRIEINSSTFYTIRGKLVKKKKTKPTKGKSTTRNYAGGESIADKIRNAVDANPEIEHQEFVKTTGTKVSSPHFSLTKRNHLENGSPESSSKGTSLRKGTNQIVANISLDPFKNIEDKVTELLRNAVLPDINKKLSLKLEAVRLHTPNAIEIRSFNSN